MKKILSYYFLTTNRRKLLDKLQKHYQGYYSGVVLDIGGRDRGNFHKPKDKVDKWLFADIVAEHNPDIVLDVVNMSQLATNSIDVINAIELFEHVSEPEIGIQECYRILKSGGYALISTPFMYPIHADPYDFQRWTEEKWKYELEKCGFCINKIEIVGGYFTVLGDMIKNLVKSFFLPFKLFGYIFFPIIDLFKVFDKNILNKKGHRLQGYNTGYFIIVRKPN